MPTAMKTRRQMLWTSGAIMASLAIPRPAWSNPSLDRVQVILDYLYQGPNVGFLMAQDKGFYAQVGLDVDVVAGKGSSSTAQMIASKVASFGFSDGYVVAKGFSKGMNLKMVGSVYRRNPTAVLSLKSSNILLPKQLEGKKVGIAAGTAQFQLWPAFAQNCGIDLSKVQVINVDIASAPAALITGRVDAVVSYVQGIAPAVEIREGQEVNFIWFSDHGVQVVSNGIVVHEDTLKGRPALVRAFVQASLRGFLYARQHPDEAVAAVKRVSPLVNAAITQREMEWSWKTWVTPNTAHKPLGWMSIKDWDSTVEIVKRYNGVTAAIDPNSLFTNEFVPTSASFIPPQG